MVFLCYPVVPFIYFLRRRKHVSGWSFTIKNFLPPVICRFKVVPGNCHIDGWDRTRELKINPWTVIVANQSGSLFHRRLKRAVSRRVEQGFERLAERVTFSKCGQAGHWHVLEPPAGPFHVPSPSGKRGVHANGRGRVLGHIASYNGDNEIGAVAGCHFGPARPAPAGRYQPRFAEMSGVNGHSLLRHPKHVS